MPTTPSPGGGSQGRRVAITSTPAGGGSSVTTSYLWCDSALCQARDASNATTREYMAEGEYVPGVTPETDYYGIDQIGSVRRVFASTSSAAAFSYDPYGVPLQTTAPTTDFTYAGIFQNADSGLDLTLYRAYDPVAGRWLSRDPLGDASNPVDGAIRFSTAASGTNVPPMADSRQNANGPADEINSFVRANDLYVYVGGEPRRTYAHGQPAAAWAASEGSLLLADPGSRPQAD